MDGNGLISFLEGIRHDIPAPLQGEFDDTVKLIRNIVDALEQVVAPPDVIQSGKQRLQAHHSTLLDHASTLQSALADFQAMYTGPGSDAYHQAANHSLQQLNLLNEHLSFAIGAHDAIASNLEDALVAMTALGLILAAFIATTFLLPEGVLGWAAEGMGAGISLADLGAAMAAVGSTLLGLAEAALPWVVGIGAALVAVTWLSSDAAPAHPAQQAHPATISVPLDWADSPDIAKWRDQIIQKLKARGLSDAQIRLALARAAAIVKALECAGLTPAEIDNFMSMYGDIYYPSGRQWGGGGQPKGSFWYSVSLLVYVATGGKVRISGLNFPDPVPVDQINQARRIVRALIDPTGTNGDGMPISPAAITGGPANVQGYSQHIYQGPDGREITQSQYNSLPPDKQSQYEDIGEADIITKDGKNIEVGGSSKGGGVDGNGNPVDPVAFQNQLQRLINLPGGKNAAYCVLEQPQGGPGSPAWSRFERAVETANSTLGPDHVIILNAPSDSCTIP